MVRTPRLLIERLEDRCVPANWGNPWPDAAHLTLSFAPDGTPLSGQNSNLFQTLNASSSTATWQRAMLRAFQTWAVEAGINFGIVSDGGQAFGSAGRPQGDPRFGDVRIGAATFSKEVLIFSSPFDPTGGTASGDVRVNSAQWGTNSIYDLYTVMLQEAGHVLGIGNSTDPTSVMYEDYLGKRLGLSAADIASAQNLYGVRLPDSYEGSSGNNSLSSATSLGLLKDSDGLLSTSIEADLGKGDRDFYRVQATTLGSLEITLERSGLSLLTPRVTVYDDSGKVVGSAVSTDPTGGNLKITVSGLKLLGNYRIAVEGASGDVFDVGSYRLKVRQIPLLNSLTGTLSTVTTNLTSTLLNNDLHTNDSIFTASLLGGLLSPTTTSKFDVAYRASISDTSDVDYYRVMAPTSGGSVMQVMAWGVGTSQLLPRISVYNSAGSLVASEVLVNEAGVYTIQVTGVTPGAAYYVKVSAALSSGPSAVGNYFLGIDFNDHEAQLASLAAGTLDATTPTAQGTLSVQRTGLFHFVIGADGDAGMAVELAILDSKGNVVGKVRANGGDTVSLTLMLAAGDYTIRTTAISLDGKPIRPVKYRLSASVLSDPAGPQPEDTTTSSSSTSTTNSTSGPYYSPAPSSSSSSSTTTYSWYSYSPPPNSSSSGCQQPYGSGYTV